MTYYITGREEWERRMPIYAAPNPSSYDGNRIKRYVDDEDGLWPRIWRDLDKRQFGRLKIQAFMKKNG